ncbi:MAG: hypothetical protein OXF68_13830 [Gammaproteobacteria bacterium]|nr:hypothetical protein [Gammaproteobacteria bacterium]
MPVRLDKPWRSLDAAADLPGQLGVFELADEAGRVCCIGYAGGRSRFGLRSEVSATAERIPEARRFRVEVTAAYLTRHRELLMAHQTDHGALPSHNDPPPRLGTLSPA